VIKLLLLSAPSLIHIRLQNLDRQTTVHLLLQILSRIEQDLVQGCIASVGPGGIRVRPLPL
jgi:hypothetical protein